MVEVLNNPEVSKLLNDLMGGTATIMEKSFVQIYTSDDKKGRFIGSNLSGVCCVIFDRREGKAAYIRVYDVTRLRLLFSMELPYGFADTTQLIFPNFMVTPFFQGYVGFLFPSAQEAKKIFDKAKQIAPKKADLDKILKQKEEDRKAQEKAEKEKHSFGGKLKGFFGVKSEEKKQEQKITGPTGFKHNTSIKMDTTGEINLDNLPDEFKQIFKKAGISKKDLQDTETALEIMKMVDDFQKNGNQAPPPPPPPPPPPTKGLPPPPPPPPPPKGLPPPPPPAPLKAPGQQQQQGQQKPANDRNALLGDIQKGIQLKPVSKPVPQEVKVVEMNQTQKEDLTDYLGRMIAERRAQMTKGRKNSTDESDDDSD